MSPVRLAALLCGVALLCACASSGVHVEHYSALYTTHFEGIPDESRVCAVIANQSSRPVEWVRLRLRSESANGLGRFTSHWVFEGRLEPGESVDVELVDPPVAERAHVSIQRAGRTARPPRGRPVERSETCTSIALRQQLLAEAADRTAPVELHEATVTETLIGSN